MNSQAPCLLATIVFPCLVGACAGDLSPDDNGDDDVLVLDAEGGPNVGHIDEGGGVFFTQVEATSDVEWVYLDLDSGTQLQVSDPLDDAQWDVAFQRFHIKVNGGVSGGASVDVAAIEAVDFEDVEAAPSDGYRSDEADGQDDDENPEYALKEWYEYDISTHILSPVPVVYVIRGAQSQHHKVQFESYYDDAGSSGYPSFRWSQLRGPQ